MEAFTACEGTAWKESSLTQSSRDTGLVRFSNPKENKEHEMEPQKHTSKSRLRKKQETGDFLDSFPESKCPKQQPPSQPPTLHLWTDCL